MEGNNFFEDESGEQQGDEEWRRQQRISLALVMGLTPEQQQQQQELEQKQGEQQRATTNNEEEENEPIIVDIGSGMCRAGFAGQDAPSCYIPSVVGRPKYELVMKGVEPKEIYVGFEVESSRGVLELKYPIERGVVKNWEELEIVWHHTFYSELRVAPEEHAILVTEPPLNPKATRERICQLMFDSFNVPAMYVELAAVLTLYAAGRAVGLLVDIGDGVSQIVPIYEGYLIPSGISRIDVAGRDLTEYMQRLLMERGYRLTDSAEKDMARELKESLAHVVMDFDEAMKIASKSSTYEKTFELPDGNKIVVNDELFRCPEALFQPKLLGREAPGIHTEVFKCIQNCDIDLRRMFYSNIILAGGSTLFPGFPQRLQREIQDRTPGTIVVKVVAPNERKFSTWIGGSILASLSTFQSQWVLRQEYDEQGPSVIHVNTNLSS